jgi:hypothetical protein
VDPSVSGYFPMLSSCEHGSEPSGYITQGIFTCQEGLCSVNYKVKSPSSAVFSRH